MKRFALIAAAALIAALLRSAFFSALPQPIAAVDLPLILIVGLVGAFRFREALLAAAVAGVTADALSAMPFGVHVAASAAAAALAVLLFTRVFTSHSWPGFLGINAAAFALLHLALAVARLGRAMLGGWPPAAALGGATAAGALSALGLQLAAVLMAMLLAAWSRRAFSRFFFIR